MIYEYIVTDSAQGYDGKNAESIVKAGTTMNSLMGVSSKVRQEVSNMSPADVQGLIVMDHTTVNVQSKAFERHDFCRPQAFVSPDFCMRTFETHDSDRGRLNFPPWYRGIKNWVIDFHTCLVRFCYVEAEHRSRGNVWALRYDIKCTIVWIMEQLSRKPAGVQNVRFQFSCNCGPAGVPGDHEFWRDHRFREGYLARCILHYAAKSRLPGRLTIAGSEHLPRTGIWALAVDCLPAYEDEYRRARNRLLQGRFGV